MACPGSVRLSFGQNTPSTDYAKEGTHAHTLGETCLRRGNEPEEWIGKKLIDHEGEFEVTEEMAEAVTVYTDFIRSLIPGGYVFSQGVEVKVSLEDLHPEMWGTADYVLWDKKTLTLHVVDYKHGAGHAVQVKDNPQALFYAAGARRLYPDVERIRISIVQPRCEHPDGVIRTEDYDWLDLLGFEQRLQAAAKATQDPEAAIVAGAHCKFCPAASFCNARRESLEQMAQDAFGELYEPNALTPDQMGKILKRAHEFRDWAKAVVAYAQKMAQQGDVPTGYKIVSKLGHRKWENPVAAEVALAVWNVPIEQIYAPKKLKSVAQMEKAVGREVYNKLVEGEFIERPETAILVPESDERPAISRGPDNEFGDLEWGT
jgi:hypothetical protein